MRSRKIIIILSISIASLFSSCNSEENGDTIRRIPLTLDIESIPLITNDYKLSFELIPLGANDSVIIGDYENIRVYDNYLITLNRISKEIFIFRRDGSYIAQIPIGRGPEEVIMPFMIFINEDYGTLEILDYSVNKVVQYDFDGKFIGVFDQIESPMNIDFAAMGNKYIFYNAGRGGDKYPSLFTIIDNNEKEVTTRYFFNRMENIKEALFTYGSFMRFSDTLFFNAFYNNIIYGLTASDTIPFPVYSVDNVFNEDKNDFSSEEEFSDYCKSKGYARNLSEIRILDNGNLWAFSIIYSDKYHVIFWDRATDKIYRSVFTFPMGWLGMPIMFTSDGIYSYHRFTPDFVNRIKNDIIHPDTYPLYEMIMERYNKYGEDDNPYVIAVKYEKK